MTPLRAYTIDVVAAFDIHTKEIFDYAAKKSIV